MMLQDEDRDPLDFSRTQIQHAARFIANYASMIEELMVMRDDDTAKVLHRKMIAQANAMTTAFRALAGAHIELPARDAKAYFDRPEPAPISEAVE